MSGFDRRLTPARPDLAAGRYRGVIPADAYVEGWAARVIQPVVGLSPEPRPDVSIDSQLIFGEAVTVYENDSEGWSWVQSARDGYVGYVPTIALSSDRPATTHYVAALRTLLFPGPDFKLPSTGGLTEGAEVTVVSTTERRGTLYAILADGAAVIARHLLPIGTPAGTDYVAFAERMVGTPYLWGGRTSLGVDCSGLVQTSMMLAGQKAPRDSDMQAVGLGALLASETPLDALLRGDLIFWKGHVGIIAGPGLLLHANGFHMATVIEPLMPAVQRIAAAGSAITVMRRPG